MADDDEQMFDEDEDMVDVDDADGDGDDDQDYEERVLDEAFSENTAAIGYPGSGNVDSAARSALRDSQSGEAAFHSVSEPQLRAEVEKTVLFFFSHGLLTFKR